MHVPPPFAVAEDEAWRLLAQSGLGVLVTPGLEATHLPFLVDPERRRLLGHVARANPHPRVGDGEALVVFPGPSAYVSPSWYPSKAEHGRVVPTWNYQAVHVRGRLSWFDTPERLLDVVDQVSRRFEADRPRPWSVADAPAGYIDRLLGAIVGVEIAVERIEGVRKLSQNRPEPDHAGVAAGLSEGSPSEQAVAALMRA